jgi:hypothetical protein
MANIDKSKVETALDKIGANPELLDGLSREWGALVSKLGIELTREEQHLLLNSLPGTKQYEVHHSACPVEGVPPSSPPAPETFRLPKCSTQGYYCF